MTRWKPRIRWNAWGLLRRDDGISDVVGTSILLAVTVMLIGSAAVAVRSTATPPVDAPRVSLILTAQAGQNSVTIVNGGGATYDRGDLRAIVVVNGASWFDANLGAAGTPWLIGDLTQITPLSGALPLSAHVEVYLVARARGAVVGNAVVDIPASTSSTPPAPSGYSVTVRFGNGLSAFTLVPPADVLLVAQVVHPSGRKSVRSVTANVSSLLGSAVTPLYDDGTHGDTVPSDGNYTTTFIVNSNLTLGTKRINVTATDFNGAKSKGSANVTATDSLPLFNTALLKQVGFRVIKYAGGNSGDKVSVHLKAGLVDDPITFEDGTTWKLVRAYLEFDPFKPGNQAPVELKDANVQSGEGWFCQDTTKKIKAFKGENVTLPMFKKSRDTLRFKFTFEWKSTSGNSYVSSALEAADPYDKFLLRSVNDYKLVNTNGWPTKLTDCSDP